MTIEPSELAQAFTQLVAWATGRAPVPERVIRRRLRGHVAVEPSTLPVVSADLLSFERPNFQLALESYLSGGGRSIASLFTDVLCVGQA